MIAALDGAVIGPRHFATSGWDGWEPTADAVAWTDPPRRGKRRWVHGCALPDGTLAVLKVNRRRRRPTDEGRFARAMLRDENDLEQRTLRRVERIPELRRYFPRFVGRGLVNGHDAIVVTRAHVGGRILSLQDHALAGRAGSAIRRRLREICRLMAREHVLCNDVSARNVVLHEEGNGLVPMVIDGFGDHHLIPYPTLSRRLNAIKLRRRFARIEAKLDELERHGREERALVRGEAVRGAAATDMGADLR